MASDDFKSGVLKIVYAFLGAVILYYLLRRKQRQSSLPGPTPLPLVGNILDLPPQGRPEYLHWLKFKDRYGGLSAITVLGTCLVIIHDKEAAHVLLEKTSMKTSARPKLHFASDLCGFGVLLPLQQYDTEFRHHRRLIHRQLGTRAIVEQFRGIQDVESHRFLLRVLDDPVKLFKHIKTEAGAIMLKLTYGYSIEPHASDPLVDSIEHMMHNFALAIMPMAWPVDFIPLWKYIPEWFPGVSFKSIARGWKEINRTVFETPYAFVKRRMATGNYYPSYAASLIKLQQDGGSDENETSDEYSEEAIKITAAVMFAGGADTTVSTISSFVLAMLLFPDVQRKAQEEIDSVVSAETLPQFEHRERLPYVNALIKESLRWLPVVPIGTTHVSEEDIMYAGYRITKGAYLLPAIWWFLHDPQTYADPSSFNPERFLQPRNEPDPASEAFGYGRRICPGRYLADESVFITISRLLAAFDIQKATDEHGQVIEPQVEVTPGLISRPLDFPYKISVRSDQHRKLIKAVELEHPWDSGDADLLKQSLVRDN